MHWDRDFAARAPAFAAFNEVAQALRLPEWPSCDDLNRILAARTAPVINESGQPLRFVEQAARAETFEAGYEPRIFLHGEVQFRVGGWHDLFNALAWLAFPRIKAALNEGHFHALGRQRASGAHNRTAVQDALTLFDESGVIVVTADRELGGLLAAHEWKALFWRRRADVVRSMRFWLFGHGLAEKMLSPFVGVTGRGLICAMPPDFMTLPPADQLTALDAHIATRVGAQGNLTASELTPVPLLGIPGWCADNENEAYYGNTKYFRPLRAPTADRR
ncbi:MAG: putative transrane protein [Betaproteobacteria bacterium]|nr:putative transrane protein [Betaproteobacteria bacterium]